MGSDGRPDIVPTMHLSIRMQAVADGHVGVMGAERSTLKDEGRSLRGPPLIILTSAQHARRSTSSTRVTYARDQSL